MIMTEKQVGGVIVLFGGTGDLAKSEIIPALYHLFQKGNFSEQFALIGVSRKEMSYQDYRDFVREAMEDVVDKDAIDDSFFQHFFYQTADNTELNDFKKLSETIQKASDECEADPSYIYYYSIPPSVYDDTTKNLKESGILDYEGSHRVAVEKPFGESLESAEEYYDLLQKAFDPQEIYLVDHFLGFESLQNILVTRQANPFLEAVWNSDYIEQVQISLPEDFSIGSRGAFYDENGALLDMFQNHILQILAVVAMDLPEEMDDKKLNEKKLELFRTIPSFKLEDVKEKVVRGQYDTYREEDDVPEESYTETYIAIELEIDSDRWAGVPFYVRTGKSLAENHLTVDILLKTSSKMSVDEHPRLTFSIEPQLGLSMVVHQKHPTESEEVLAAVIGPDKETWKTIHFPEAYENIISDILTDSERHIGAFEQVKEQWRITDSIRQAWEDMPKPDFPNYKTGEIGPEKAEDLLKRNNHSWIYRI